MRLLAVDGLFNLALLLCGGILLFVNEHFCHKFIHGGTRAAGAPRLWAALLGTALLGFVWMMGWVLRLPMAALYLLLLAGSYLSYKISLPKGEVYTPSGGALFWSTLLFTARAFGHTALLATLSLCLGSTPGQTYQTYYIPLFLFAEIVPALLGLALSCGRMSNLLTRLAKDSGQLRQCLTFLVYAAVYSCFDALLVRFELPYWQVSAFLLGSCLLIAVQLLLFIVDTDSIIRLAAHKLEYDRLEEQRAEQIRKGITLQNLAYRDSLTGAYNRRYAEEMLSSLKEDYTHIAVAYIDVDGLKKVNDKQGHQMGDSYLCAAADCLNSVLRKTDVLARIGGDEFLVISTEQHEAALSRSLYHANAALRSGERGVSGSFSFGVAEIDGAELDVDAALRESDRRMYRQKVDRPHREVSGI